MYRDQLYDYHYFCNLALMMLFTQKQHLTHITVILSEILTVHIRQDTCTWYSAS